MTASVNPQRCSESDLEAEMEMSEQLDAMRCRRQGCGTGLGYRVRRGHDGGGAEEAGPFELARGGRSGRASGSGCWRRCVHCGGEWAESEGDDDDGDD